MLLIATLLISFSNAEVAVGFGQESNAPWYCWFSHCDKVNQNNPYSGSNYYDNVYTGGTGGIIHVGEGCTVAECVADGWNAGECEAYDGWYCVPFTLEAKRCDANDGCEKHTSEWSGNGKCDFEKCGNCHAYWVKGIFDGGDCTADQMKRKEPAKPEGYKPVVTGALCEGKAYLKGFKTSSKAGCQQNCDGRSGCDTFCWSGRSPEWDCLLYTSCSATSSRFSSGNSASTYSCYQKPGAEAASMLTDVVAQPVAAVDPLMVKFFAFIGLLSVVIVLFRTAVTSKSTESPVPTENTPFETTTTEI